MVSGGPNFVSLLRNKRVSFGRAAGVIFCCKQACTRRKPTHFRCTARLFADFAWTTRSVTLPKAERELWRISHTKEIAVVGKADRVKSNHMSRCDHNFFSSTLYCSNTTQHFKWYEETSFAPHGVPWRRCAPNLHIEICERKAFDSCGLVAWISKVSTSESVQLKIL